MSTSLECEHQYPKLQQGFTLQHVTADIYQTVVVVALSDFNASIGHSYRKSLSRRLMHHGITLDLYRNYSANQRCTQQEI